MGGLQCWWSECGFNAAGYRGDEEEAMPLNGERERVGDVASFPLLLMWLVASMVAARGRGMVAAVAGYSKEEEEVAGWSC
jgi:hypothetical protein